MPVNAPVFDETILVDTLLDNDENIIESIDSLGSPTLSKVQILRQHKNATIQSTRA